MSTLAPAVSIVVPCRNEGDHIESCLMSILGQQSPAGGFEVIIADGMSNDASREILEQVRRQDPRLHVVENPGRIVSTGLNAGIRLARGKIIVRMDAHTEYAPDYLSKCVKVLEETKADNVGGPWVAEGKGLLGRAIAAAFRSAFSSGGSRGRNPDYEGALDTVYLGCWPREVFDRIGLFDEELVRNQDDEFNLRLSRAGGKIWQSPRIQSRYKPRESLCALFVQFVQYGYWKVRVIQKHKLPASIRHLIPACFVLSIVTLPLLSIWWPPASLTWLLAIAIYILCAMAVSFAISFRYGWQLFPLLPAVFFCQHVAYGYGFLRGLLDFVILGRKPTPAYTQLTRPSTSAEDRKNRNYWATFSE